MPPPSSPVPRLSSGPSDVFTVHTIASRSPLRPIVSAIRERDGRPPRPILGDVIATTTPPHRQRTAASKQQGSASKVCHPSRLVLVLFLQVVRKGRAKEQTENEKREPGRRMPPPSSPVPRLSSGPSDVFTVHTIASRSPLRPIVSAIRERDGRPPRPILGDAIATTSPPHRQRTAASKQQGSASTV